MVLEQYPDEVIVFVTDPRTGVQRSCKWPPTIAEIVEACDLHLQDLARLKRWQNWGKPDEVPLLEQPREERPTLEELKAKYGENWGLALAESKRPQAPPLSWDEAIARSRIACWREEDQKDGEQKDSDQEDAANE